MHGHRGKIFAGLLLALLLITGGYQMHKPLPEGVSTATPWRPAADVEFLADLTWVDEAGVRHSDQAIFDEAFRLIGQAKRFVLLDMFLFSDFAGGSGEPWRPLTEQLARALLERKDEVPGLRIVFITDPFNTLYGGVRNPWLEKLEAAGVKVIDTDLTQLRDPNPAWSSIWRLCCQWFGNSRHGWLPSPVGSEPVTLRTYMELLNFKANHRKTLAVDNGDGWAGLVTSGNPHSASSRHSNVALKFEGPAVPDLMRTESSVAAFSGDDLALPDTDEPARSREAPALRIVTEADIRNAVLDILHSAERGDALDLQMFYLSHRQIIEALKDAQRRGVDLRVLLDPNKDAFGRKKNGVPNRPVAAELHRAGIPIRWCDTHGEQCHAKMLIHRPKDRPARLFLGSANFTRRNLDNFNLETNVELRAESDHPALRDATGTFEVCWNNTEGRLFSVPYAEYADDATWKYWLYRFTEATGLSTY
jgi:phosphatidylserine/phosphatidylglycerophosphate/cardiolipin synthase-like enzyme